MTEGKKKKKSWDTIRTNDDTKRWDEQVKKHDFRKKAGDYTTHRLIDSPTSGAKHWVEFTKNGAKKGFSTACYSFNNETDSFEGRNHCPACKLDIKAQVFYATHAIDREAQEQKPSTAKPEKPNAKGFKDIEDKGWSPVSVLIITSSLAKKIGSVVKLNKHKIDGKTVCKSIESPKFGMDVDLMFDPTAKGEGMYDIQKGEKSPLTEEEKNYLLYDLSIIPNFANSQEEGSMYYNDRIKLEKDLIRLGYGTPAAKDESEDEGETLPKSKARSTRDEDEDEEDEAPKKSAKRPPADEEDDEMPVKKKSTQKSDDFDDEDEEEEEAPVKKKKAPIVDEDEEEEEAPAKKKRPAEDEEDEMPVKKKKAPIADEDEEEEAPVKKKKKPAEDDDWS